MNCCSAPPCSSFLYNWAFSAAYVLGRGWIPSCSSLGRELLRNAPYVWQYAPFHELLLNSFVWLTVRFISEDVWRLLLTQEQLLLCAGVSSTMKPAADTTQLFNSLQLSHVSSAASWPAGVTGWPGGASSTRRVTACGVTYLLCAYAVKVFSKSRPVVMQSCELRSAQLSVWCLCRPPMSEYISRQQKSCSVLLSDENFFSFFFFSRRLLFRSLSILLAQIHNEYHNFIKVIKSLIMVTSQRNHKTN